MIDHQTINEIASKLSDVIPDSVKVMKSDIDNNLRAVLESSLQQMNLVSREEFDTQSALLSRTLEKIEQLEAQLKELEENL